MNSKVVLKACSTDEMQTKMIKQSWEKDSNAARLGADISPKGPQVLRAEPTVTVTLLAAIPQMAKESDPYTFTVTAWFDSIETENTAFATLHINYVSFRRRFDGDGVEGSAIH